MTINFITRQEWGAREPDDVNPTRTHPTEYVYVHHVAGNMSMREIQDLHMDRRGWDDVGYNFVIEKSGDVNIGRGFGVKGGGVLDPENWYCHSICLNGNYQIEQPTTAALLALTELLAMGERLGHWLIDVRGHRDTMDTSCPGDNLYSLLPTIENSAKHWAEPIPIPIPEEDEDMPVIIGASGKPAALLSGGVMVPFKSASTLSSLNKAGVKTATVNVGDYERFRVGFMTLAADSAADEAADDADDAVVEG